MKAGREPGPASVGDLERSIVAMMVAGWTDRAIARQHHMGVRTLQRIIATLMADVGAGNRAALGAAAAHRGWIDVPSVLEGAPCPHRTDGLVEGYSAHVVVLPRP